MAQVEAAFLSCVATVTAVWSQCLDTTTACISLVVARMRLMCLSQLRALVKLTGWCH